MAKSVIVASAAALFILAGCEQADAPAPAPTETTEVPVETLPTDEEAVGADASHRYAGWAGKWTGVEGMYVTVTPGEAGAYRLEMQSDLDTMGRYDAKDGADGIDFVREGETLTLRQGSGDETGLKYLAGKSECLIVKPGEGYCRD